MDDITSSFFTVTGATSSLIAVCVIGAALVLPLPLSAEEQGLILLFSVANVAASINLSPLFDAQHQQVKGALGTTVGDVLSFTVAALLAQAGLLTLWAIGVILTCKWVAGTLLQALLYHFTVRRIRFRASAHGALQMARSSFPILGSYFLCTVPLSFGVFFLRFFRGPEATGIFGLACQVGLLTFVFAWLGIRIIQPHVGGEFGLHRSFVRKLILFLALFLAGLGAAAFLGGTLVIRVGFDPAFRAAIPAMGVLIAASAILSAGVAASLYLLLFHQERRVLFVYACSAAVYLCGSALVIPEYGIGGAAAVTLASAAIGTVMMLVLASRLAGRVR
jgi:O-antigen/teichoic acid export membrane protein